MAEHNGTHHVFLGSDPHGIFQWRQSFVKNGFKNPSFFVKIFKILSSLDHTILFKFH